ncbi:RNA-directed RNA polymerase [ssRNA phage Gerhypos.1_9]|uniref:RNA-directed RNA polymerase n=2 Tax=Fiersviridae TaxID=2842319 RepID=A0A8S5KZB1_9VIRU|nr:RNA-directed RNA polymerase [ssRNA phage Gerhypos.1_9]QDH86628.1 MAG: RNA-dependent RNA polymerase [Leviviridae sp.]DAD50519.1 TPA_asm: RNA-directed RNA polymerase [ssRNA phage Gerhypos.1_9]
MHKHAIAQCLKPVSREVSEKTLTSVSSLLYEAVDTPRALAAHLLLKYGEYAQLVNLDVDPSRYLKATSFADDYLVSKFLSKYPDFAHADLDPKERALESFFKYEDACKETNQKIIALREDPSTRDPFMWGVLTLTKRKIAQVLGPVDLDLVAERFGWGPGATTSSSGSHTSAYVKFAKRLDVTSNALMMGWACVNSTPSWVNCQLQTDEFPSVKAMVLPTAFNTVRGNEIVFVPKNAKTHRIIAKEPHVNSYLQKGFGSYIRERLRTVAKVNLKDQTLNQRLAREGSVKGNLATIDLSGASDTISTELVRLLLPEAWFSLLNLIRSRQGYLREKETWVHYHKFSSMGNACTFELESLIFWALCKAVLEIQGGEQTLNVYGDDIIVPTEHYTTVANVIHYVGFFVNEAKSFSDGPFRESCGKDYFLGIDVRPIFLKESISNAEVLLKVANGLRRYANRRLEGLGCDRRFLPVWSHVVSRLPKAVRALRIPEGFGDVGVVSNFDEATPSLVRPKKDESGWQGYFFRGLLRHPVKREMRDRHAGYTATLFGQGTSQSLDDRWVSSDGEFFYERRVMRALQKTIAIDNINRSILGRERLPLLGSHDLRKRTYPTVARIHTHRWCELGPWL